MPQIMVKNRDIITLSRVLYTMQDVSATEEKRMWQQDRLWHMTQKLTGMPSGHGQDGGLERIFTDICEMEEKYEAECRAYMRELKEAERIINGIKSRTMRTFVTMKYVLDMSDREIMARLNLKRWKYTRMREIVENAENMASVHWTEHYAVKVGENRTSE